MDAVAFPEMVTLLLDKGASIDLHDDLIEWNGVLNEKGGNTALMLALKNQGKNSPQSAKILIEKGANIEIQNRIGETALMMAVNNTEIAKILIDKGAKLDVQDAGGATALMKAAQKYPDVVKLLIDKGANILIRTQKEFKSAQNALDFAAVSGNIPAAKLILAKATSLGVKAEIIRVSLHWAVVANQLEMAKYLLDEGAMVEGNDDLGAFTPLMETSMLEMVQLLVKRGANVNAKNKMDYTPLHKAVFNWMGADPDEKDCEKIMQLLIEKGADVNAQDKNGDSPLMKAVQKSTPVKILLAKGAKPNLQNANGETALMYAVKGGFLKRFLGMPVIGCFSESSKLLLNAGADLNLKDKWGKTALMHAAGAVNAQGDSYSSYTDMVAGLLEKGAALEAADLEGHTALYWAQRFGRTETANLLLAKGANPAQKYDKKADKSNVKAGIVGTWTNSMKVDVAVRNESYNLVNKVVFNADWTYSKSQTANGQAVPSGAAYTTYDLRDGRIWLFDKAGNCSVVEFRFEGKTLILNGEKYTKATKK